MGLIKILVIRLDRLGDMVLTLPAIQSLKYAFPEAEISILAQPFLKEFLLTQPYISRVYEYDLNKSLIQKLKLFSALRKERFDIAFDFIYAKDILPAFLAFLSGAKKRIGFGTGLRSLFLTKAVNSSDEFKYEAERNFDILRSMGLTKPEQKFKLHLPSHLIKKTLDKLGAEFKSSLPIICIHPGVYNNEKRRLWSTEKFAILINKLIERYKANIVLTGTENEKMLAVGIEKKCKYKTINLVGKTTITDLCCLISSSDLLISTLTGVTHLGVVLHKPTIAICGPTPIKRWTNNDYIIIRKELPCSPCEHLPSCCEKSILCMESINVGDILASIPKLR